VKPLRGGAARRPGGPGDEPQREFGRSRAQRGFGEHLGPVRGDDLLRPRLFQDPLGRVRLSLHGGDVGREHEHPAALLPAAHLDQLVS